MILKNVKQVLTDSPLTAEHVMRQYALPEDLVSVVPPVVCLASDFQRSFPGQSSLRRGLSDAHPILQVDPTQPLIVCATSHFEDAGMLDLISAWPRVLDRFPTALLWILGDGLKAKGIWERICDLGLANSIVMPGFFDELDDVLLAADVYVHSLHVDVRCRSLIRAMATETCTVATENSITTDLIEKNVNGILVSKNNPEALAEAICLAVDKSELRARLGNAAGQTVRTEYDASRWVQHYLAPFTETNVAPTIAAAAEISDKN